MEITVILNETKPKTYELLDAFLLLMENSYPTTRINVNFITENTQYIFTIGGDGTMVRALREYPNIPIIGINAGTLGFLTEINQSNMKECVKRIFAKDYIVENCHTLECELIRANGENITFPYAINDIAISRSTALDMVRFDVYVNDKLMKQYNADGFIVSAPIGASAYALSCGGPLIEPTSNIIELTPIAPHTLINRSIVIDNTKEVMIEIVESRNDQKNTLLSVDGDEPIILSVGDKIKVRNSPTTITLLRLNNDSFVDNLAKKLYRI